MDAVFKAKNPDDIEFSMTLVMTMGEWKRLKDQLDNAYPSWRLASAISRLVSKAAARFEEETNIDD